MTSSRGLPQEVVSDNSTNCVEASSELRKLINQLDEWKIKISAANKIIKSHFSPCYNPHFGEMHEKMIKSTKKAIHGTLGLVVITDEDLTTALMIIIIINCFCGMVDQQEVVSLISRLGHCQKFSPLWISGMPGAGFEPVQNLSSKFNHFQIGRSGADCCTETFSCRWDHYNLSKCWSLVKHAWKRMVTSFKHLP